MHITKQEMGMAEIIIRRAIDTAYSLRSQSQPARDKVRQVRVEVHYENGLGKVPS